MTVGAYPGSFNPPTVAHLAVVDAAIAQLGLDRLDLVVSRVALGKPAPPGPRFDDRVAVLETIARRVPGLAVRVTDVQLLADVAAGYDVLVLGADKWAQVVDPAWYGDSAAARDEALARLPEVVVVPRWPWPVPGARVLGIDAAHGEVSATAARASRRDWMAPEAAAFDARTGAWTDPDRYGRLHPPE
jgi:hypothetical protein